MSIPASSASSAGSRLAVLLFTDLVGSSSLKSQLGNAAYARLLTRHDEIFKQLIRQYHAAEILQDTGDGYFAAFATATDAVRFALRFQEAMRNEPWGHRALSTRIGIHVGEVAQMAHSEDGKAKLVGVAADLASRLMSLALGGQILLTRFAFNEARQSIGEHALPDGSDPPLRWVAHGNYLFFGLDEAVEVFEVGVEGVAPLSPPPKSDKARRSVSPEQEETLGWRPAIGLPVPQRANWSLQKKLGEGTFGEVWLARNESTRQLRVFKFCFDIERLRSFKREVTFFRLLRDALGERKDIALLYDVRLDEPPFFLESGFAVGGNLLDWAGAQGGLPQIPLATRLEIVTKVADAVAAAHSVGILHKDIKPSNILIHIEPDGSPTPQLSDFGIGLLTDPGQLQSHHITDLGLTRLDANESSRTGTRMYAPPESLTGAPFTMQGDIYALGVLLYQMMVGDLERPLAPGWERDVADEVIRADITACVDGDPKRRLDSASELSRRLRSLPERRAQRQQEQQAAEVHARRRRLLRAAGVLVAACLLIAVLSIAGFFREHKLRQAIAGSEALARDREHTAQLRLMDNLILAGDSLTQAKRYSDAGDAYEEAWNLSQSLSEPPMRAISGYLQSIGESPRSLLYRRATTQPDEKGSPLARVRTSPSGRLMVVGDGNEHAFVIELPVPRIIATLPTRGWGYGICFTPDGKTCVTGGSRGQLQTWSVGDWKNPLATITDAPFVYALACAPDGREFVSVEPSGPGKAGGKIHFWSIDPLKQTRELSAPSGLLSAAYSPDGKSLATGDEKGNVLLWDVAGGLVTATLAGHSAEVVGVAYTPDGKRVLSGSLDKTARLWDVASGKELLGLGGHRGAVRDVCVSHDGKLGATASADESIKCWDLQSGKELITFGTHAHGVTSVDFLPDDSAIVSCGNNGRVAVWPLETDCAPVFKLHRERVAGISVCPDGLTALSAGWDRTVRQFDLSTGLVLRSVTTPQPVWSLALAADGKTAVLGEAHGVVELLDVYRFTRDRVKLADFGPPLRLSDPTATAPTSMPSDYTDTINTVAISPLGSAALVGGADRMMSIFPLPLGSGGFTRRPGGPVSAACFTLDGKRALLAVQQTLFLIDTASGRIVQRIPTQLRLIAAVAVSPDGKTAATGSYDDTVRVWDLESTVNTKVMTGHVGPVRAVAFLPDGKTLVSASQDNTIRLWDVTNAREMRALTAHADGACALAVAPDGSIILSGGVDGTVRKWDLSLPEKYRGQLRLFPAGLYSALDRNGGDMTALQTLGEWYAFRSRSDWAVECLERVRAAGGKVSPLLMARCYWKLNRLSDAAREFRDAIARNEAPAEYLNLCLAAVSASAK